MDSSNEPTDNLLEHFSRHQARVRRLVRSLLSDEHAAEDISQDAWVVTMQRPPGLPERSAEDSEPLGAWFGRVAQNLAKNSRRSDRRRGDRERRAGEDRAHGGSGAALPSEEIVARLELQRLLLAAVESLHEPARSLLRDHYLGEQSLAAIARRDGIPESTLRSRIKAGLAALRGQLEADGFHDEDGQSVHWSLALVPLASAPMGPASSPLDPSAGTAALATASLTLTSFAGAILMKKAALSLVSLAAVLLLTWQVSRPDRDLVPGADVPVQASSKPDPDALGIELPELEPVGVSDEPRIAAALPGAGVQGAGSVAGAAGALAIDGTLSIEGTLVPPAPTEVSIWLHSGFDSEGEVTSQHSTRSDAKGAFHLEIERPDETVTVTARASIDDCVLSGGTVVTVPLGDSRVDLGLSFARRDTAIYGTVRTPDGEPAPGARVLWNKYAVECAEDGTYEIRVASRFVYRIYAEKSGYGRTAAVANDLEPRSRRRIDFTLTEGFDVHGTVKDEDGRALVGARVGSFFRRERVDTDAEGRFVIASVSRTDRDSVEVNVSLPGFVTSSQSKAVPQDGDLEIAVVLRLGTRVAGRVVDSRGEPVAGVALTLGPMPQYFLALTARSDDQGGFAFSDVGEGQQTLWVTAEGYADLRHDLTVPKGVEVVEEILLQLDEGRTVHGIIQDEAGLPLEGVHVSMRLFSDGPRPGSYVGKRAKSGVDGAFDLAHLPARKLTVEAYAEGWVRGTAPVEADGSVVLTMQRAGRVLGRVVDGATGAPIDAFRIRSIDPQLRAGESEASGYEAGWVREGMAFEDLNGRWDFHGAEFAAGEVLGIEASAPGYAPAVKPHVVVQPAESGEEVVLELWPAIDVTVAVTIEETGAPAAGALVILCQERHLDEMDRSWSAVTNAEGRALVQGAAPGPLWIKVRPAGTNGQPETQNQESRTLGPFVVEPRRDLDSRPEPARIDVDVPATSLVPD